MNNFLEVTGIDLIPYAIGISKFGSSTPFVPTNFSDIRKKVQSLDVKKLDEALKYSKELLDEESVRGEKTESKAYNLIGVTGVSAAFITGISSLFPKESQTASSLSLTILLVSYLLIVISLTLTVLLASRAVIVRSYTHPDIADVFLMESRSLKEIKIDRLTTYMYCYAKNFQTHNIKVSYLIGAQLWFRNSIIIFLILAFILISNFLGSATINTQLLSTPTLTLSQTQSAVFVTQTLISSSATTQSTNTIEPTETPTPFPIVTSSATNISITITTAP